VLSCFLFHVEHSSHRFEGLPLPRSKLAASHICAKTWGDMRHPNLWPMQAFARYSVAVARVSELQRSLLGSRRCSTWNSHGSSVAQRVGPDDFPSTSRSSLSICLVIEG
jgi:hypothetical protein